MTQQEINELRLLLTKASEVMTGGNDLLDIVKDRLYKAVEAAYILRPSMFDENR